MFDGQPYRFFLRGTIYTLRERKYKKWYDMLTPPSISNSTTAKKKDEYTSGI